MIDKEDLKPLDKIIETLGMTEEDYSKVGRNYYGILPDHEILRLCQEHGMLNPFLETPVNIDAEGRRIVSKGLSSYGYDVTLDNKFKVYDANKHGVLDPHNIDYSLMIDIEADELIIPPNGYVLACTKEYFTMPTDVVGLCIGKSTYARLGLHINETPIEPGWEGILTLELSNPTPLPIKIYADEGIAQILFFRGYPCNRSYADKKGKYMHQDTVTGPRL